MASALGEVPASPCLATSPSRVGCHTRPARQHLHNSRVPASARPRDRRLAPL